MKNLQLGSNTSPMGSDSPITAPISSLPADVHHFFSANNPGEILGGIAGGLGFGAPAAALGAKQGGDAYKTITATSSPLAPPPPPTLASATPVGLNTELAHEQRLAAASTILTGGAGLLDEPTTASRVLLGS